MPVTFKQTLLEERRKDLEYKNKMAKGAIDRVIVELEGAESGIFTKLAHRYFRLDKALKAMEVAHKELNAQIKEKTEAFFDAEDIVLTRVIKTVSFTMTLSKFVKGTEKKKTVDYEKICAELIKLIPAELEARVKEITDLYTTEKLENDKSPALRVKDDRPGVNENLQEGLKEWIMRAKAYVKSFTAWAKRYDVKLENLAKQADIDLIDVVEL
jgi:hypothetical protein